MWSPTHLPVKDVPVSSNQAVEENRKDIPGYVACLLFSKTRCQKIVLHQNAIVPHREALSASRNTGRNKNRQGSQAGRPPPPSCMGKCPVINVQTCTYVFSAFSAMKLSQPSQSSGYRNTQRKGTGTVLRRVCSVIRSFYHLIYGSKHLSHTYSQKMRPLPWDSLEPHHPTHTVRTDHTQRRQARSIWGSPQIAFITPLLHHLTI